MLAAPPAAGELRPALMALSAKVWRHPISALDVRFAVSTMERWYYTARRANDPVSALKDRARDDLGRFPSLTPQAIDTLTTQYREHPGWAAQLHFDNLCAALKGSDSHLASYPTVRRYLKAQGMFRQAQQRNSKSSDALKRWHQWIYLLMRDVVPDVSGSKLIGRTILAENLLGKHFQRQKALVVLANEQGFSNSQISEFLGAFHLFADILKSFIQEVQTTSSYEKLVR